MSESMKVSREMQEIAEYLDSKTARAAGRRVPFTLIIFTDGVGSFITTGRSEDNIKELHKVIEVLASEEPLIPLCEAN